MAARFKLPGKLPGKQRAPLWGSFNLLLPFPRLVIDYLAGFVSQVNAADDYKVGDKLAPTAQAKEKNSSGMPAGPGAGFKEKTWDDLMPKSWDPMASLKGLKLENLQDSDPRAMEALQKIRDAWNNAPIEPSLNGERIRIPGFVIPLEKSGSKVTEFLLVPYFGACIHTPPPPPTRLSM